jgi:hypothetical protein
VPPAPPTTVIVVLADVIEAIKPVKFEKTPSLPYFEKPYPLVDD